MLKTLKKAYNGFPLLYRVKPLADLLNTEADWKLWNRQIFTGTFIQHITEWHKIRKFFRLPHLEQLGPSSVLTNVPDDILDEKLVEPEGGDEQDEEEATAAQSEEGEGHLDKIHSEIIWYTTVDTGPSGKFYTSIIKSQTP